MNFQNLKKKIKKETFKNNFFSLPFFSALKDIIGGIVKFFVIKLYGTK